MKKLALLVLIMGVVLVSSAVGQEFTDVTVGSADPGSAVVTEGVYEVSGNGNDIWDNADAFQYYYTELVGDGMMVARVVDMGEGSNDWAKGGVMVRQSLDAGSMHAITAITGSAGGGAGFQRRVATDGSSDSNHDLADGPYAAPYWVKTVRIGNDFTGYISADGETWVQVGDAVTIEMADPVLIGLAVTSHAAGELRTVTFDNVAVESISPLAGWWPLNEGVGETVADMSGNGMDGTINNPTGGLGADGAAWVEDAVRGNVFSSDGLGTGAYIRAGSIPQMTLENDFTWAFWAKQDATNTADNDIIVGNRYNEDAADFAPRQFIKFTPTKFEWHMNGNGDDNMDYEDIPADVWLHHAVVKTGDQLTYYRNGVAASSGVITQAMDVAMPLYLSGDNSAADGENWGGMLSDVHTLNEALSQQDIQGVMGSLAPVTLAAWEAAATAAAPSFLATNVEDGIYDIGALSGDITYEFLVRSNPDEEQASMALIGRRNFGDTEVGLKYEQWNNTGTYGATVFGVADYDYGVATNPGVITHLAFVSSEDTATTALYVDGVLQGSIDSAISLSGPVGIGYGAQAEDGSDFFDDFDGAIYGVAIYDAALSAAQIRVNADTSLEKGPSDITGAGDMVQGVPNDGDWPGGETPDLAIDDDAATKYLHFKGETEPTGIQVTPMLGATMVTGLTLTTANDAVERDPISFELYGSNESIDGPYELIAAGAVADFNDVNDAWPRFTMNATAITFENAVAYEHYQIMFPAVRDPASANSMQIAEVELMGVPVLPAAKPVVAWVSYHAADDEPHADAAAVGFTQAPDIGYTDLLKASGYDVVRVLTSQDPNVEYLSTFDLVIISRTASSGHYSGSGATLWNSITAPLINLNGYTLRNSRLGFTDGGTMVDTTGDVMLTVTDPNHPIFAGVELVDGMMVNLFAEGAVPLTPDPTIISRGISVNTDNLDEEGTVLATVATLEDPTLGGIVIAELPAGATLQNSSGSPDDVLAGPRLVFLTGSREPDGVTGGQAAALYDLYEDGTVMFLNAVAYMLP
jgi:concanavalin A-like lectin/glucanase superfamily protein